MGYMEFITGILEFMAAIEAVAGVAAASPESPASRPGRCKGIISAMRFSN